MRSAAIIGCGERGGEHARAYAQVRGGALTSACDLDEDRLKSFCAAHSIARGHRSIDELLEKERPDLVHVVMPPKRRAEVVAQIVRHRPGAVLLEKPLSERPEDGLAVVDLCRRAGVALFVNHQLRFHRSVLSLRERIRAGQLGEVGSAAVFSKWNAVEMGTHLFDLLSFLLDDRVRFESVYAQTTGRVGDNHLTDAPAYASGVIDTDRGWHVSFECGAEAAVHSRSSQASRQSGVVLVGELATAVYSTGGATVINGSTPVEEEHVFADDDLPAQAALVDSIFSWMESPGDHSNDVDRSMIAFDVYMRLQLASLRREWIVRDRFPVDEEIEQLRRMQS